MGRGLADASCPRSVTHASRVPHVATIIVTLQTVKVIHESKTLTSDKVVWLPRNMERGLAPAGVTTDGWDNVGVEWAVVRWPARCSCRFRARSG